jgi:replicative DNA helicase
MSVSETLAANIVVNAPSPQLPELKPLIDGGDWILDGSDEVGAVWGEGTSVLWSSGEPCYLVGPPGVGKSTLAQQLVLARIGARPTDVLGFPVADDGRPVLYLAADRAKQVKRSLRRMVREDDRPLLNERLRVWRGPLTFSVIEDTEQLTRVAERLGVGTVVVDSAKDLAADLETGPTGSGFNHAMQHLVTNGVEVLVLHHQRKANGQNKRPKTLDDVYGSTWLTGGAGSVLLLWGQAGDPIVEMKHLKQPADLVGPLTLRHDHETGTTTLADPPVDPLELLLKSPNGVTAKDLAAHYAQGAEPSTADVERARRKLDALVRDQHAHRRDGDKGRRIPATYVAAARA